MSNMRVKMILDLVANTGKGAAQAKRDLAGIRGAAGAIKGGAGSGADRLRRDLERLTPAARKAAREMAIASHRERQIGRDGGISRTKRQLDEAARSARRLNTELRATAGVGRGGRGAGSQGRTPLGVLPVSGGGRRARGGAAAAPAGASGGGASLLAAGRGLMPVVGAYAAYQGAKAVARNTVGKSISFESAMADVKRKVDLPDGGSFEQIEEWINQAALRFGKSRTEIAGLVAELGAAGIGYNDLSKAIELNTKAAVAWDMTANETGETMAKIRTGQNWNMSQLEDFGDKVNALADAGASKERDIVEMFQRAGASGLISGLDANTSLAFLTAMNSAGIAPEVSARGYSTMMSILRTAGSNSTDKQEEGYALLGLTGADIEKGMRTDGLKTILDFVNRFTKSTDQAGAAVKIFGREWWDEFSRLTQAMPEVQKNLAIVADPSKWRGSMGKSLNIELATSANHLARLEAMTSKIGDNLGRWMLPGINEGVNKIIGAMDAFDEAMRKREQAKGAGERIATGQTLTDEQIERYINDDGFAASADQKAYEHSQKIKDKQIELNRRNITRNHGDANQGNRRRNEERLKLDKEIEGIERALKAADPSGRSPMLRARREELARLRKQRSGLGPMWTETNLPPDPQITSFQDQRAKLQKEIDRSEQGAVAHPQEAKRFRAHGAERRRSLAKLDGQIRRILAPSVTPIQTYGDQNIWGKPIDANNPGTIGSGGTTAFGLNRGGYSTGGSWDGKARKGSRAGSNWARKVNSDLDVDLDHGMTIRLGDKIAASILAAGGQAQAAAQTVVDGAKSALAGADLTEQGRSLALSFANGITAGVPWVASAAAKLAATAKAGAAGAGAGGGRINGALHDGVE